jgi:hypothetical protein
VNVIRIRYTRARVMKDTIEIVLDDGSNRVAVWRNVFVHVRSGAQTEQSLDLLIGSWRSLKHRVSGDIFAFSIIAADAETVSVEVRKRRAAVVKEMTAHALLHLAAVIEGEGLLADLRRIMARGVTDSRTKICSDTREAARTLAALPSAPSVDEMLAVIDATRNHDRDCPMSSRSMRSGRKIE